MVDNKAKTERRIQFAQGQCLIFREARDRRLNKGV
jgi:hypothetical protein